MSANLKFISALLCLVFCVRLSAQESRLKVTSKRNDDRSVTLFYEKKDNGTHTVVLKFKELSNSSLPNYEYVAEGYNGELVTLKPIRSNESITYSYSYRYIRGKTNTTVNENITYAIPYVTSSAVRVGEAGYFRSRYFGAEAPSDWKVYNFYTDKQQTVTACRKGEVVEIVDEFDSENLEDYTYTSQRNSILIEHDDGTLMRYSGLEKGSSKVKPGQIVFPGDELALNVKRGEDLYMVSCMLYYLKTVNFDAVSGNVKTAGSLYGFVTPQYAVNTGTKTILQDKETYKAFIDNEMITQEMSKKELKKHKKK